MKGDSMKQFIEKLLCAPVERFFGTDGDPCQYVVAILVPVCLGLILGYGAHKLAKKRPQWFGSTAVRGVLLGVISLILVFLFMNPPTTAKKCEPPKCTRLAKLISESSLETKLVEQEIQKAFSEIQARIGHIDSWFHLKFVFAGVMLALIAKFGDVLKEPLNEAITHPAVAFLLASACVVALATDIHIRIEQAMTGMLGRWIADYVEPYVEPTEPTEVGPIYWENFLRTNPGVHTSWITQFTFSPHLHFLTWPLYICYVWVFQEVALKKPMQNMTLMRGSFVIVQVSLWIYVVVAHSTPLAYGLKVKPWSNGDPLEPGYALAVFLCLYAFVYSLSQPYLSLPRTESADTTDKVTLAEFMWYGISDGAK
jgi:hypothetical protein